MQLAQHTGRDRARSYLCQAARRRALQQPCTGRAQASSVELGSQWQGVACSILCGSGLEPGWSCWDSGMKRKDERDHLVQMVSQVMQGCWKHQPASCDGLMSKVHVGMHQRAGMSRDLRPWVHVCGRSADLVREGCSPISGILAAQRRAVLACCSRATGQAAVSSRLCTSRHQPTASTGVWKASWKESPSVLISYLQRARTALLHLPQDRYADPL